ncbi:MAG TPA: YbhB/YbcL family Raf kinase inhibitor-like protein [Ignavibacteriaceae bacterium]
MANKYLLYSLIAIVLVVGGVAILNSGKNKQIQPGNNVSMTDQINNQTPTKTATPAASATESAMVVSSPAFSEGQQIPSEYTCDGTEKFPPLVFVGVPSDAVSLALVIDDPDAPGGTWTHFVAWNINPKVTEINTQKDLAGSVKGTNDFKKTDYGGPCPPSGTHRYYFKLYALDNKLDLTKGTKDDLFKAIEGHIITQSSLMGTYSKQ